MTPTATNTGLPTDLTERVTGLTPEQREELSEIIDTADMPPPDPQTDEQLMADLIRDAELADAGLLPSLTREQAKEQVRKELREKYGFEL